MNSEDLPASARKRLAIAAAADNYHSSFALVVHKSATGPYFSLCAPGPRCAAVGESGEICWISSGRWLHFPEEDRERIKEFKPGTGFVAWSRDARGARIGSVLAKPGVFEGGGSSRARWKCIGARWSCPGTDYMKATETLEQAVPPGSST